LENILLLPSHTWQAIEVGDREKAMRIKRRKGKRPQDYSRVILPLVTGAGSSAHWILVVMNFKADRLEVYDSFHHDYPKVVEKIQAFLESDGKKLSNVFYSKAVPKQDDGYNCGMYAIAFARAVMRNRPFPDSYDTAKHDTADVLSTIEKDIQKYADKLNSFRTDTFDSSKYRSKITEREKQSAIRTLAKSKRKVKKHEEHKAKKEAKKKAKIEAKAEAERLAKEAEEGRIEKLKELGRTKMQQILNRPKPVPKSEPELPKSIITWKTPQKRNRKRK
jgi:hypothetical protein